ncbi:hypothetical protein FGIG_06393 [Fasciola gigantica]|uniref:Uncharacterized protein n=1 Tax=Fasciola gigantica TaxID=46835 RepID=A0A504YPT9_FASGI|nr:hypothetical protein FGIG_06393 [Fasciola gigantica]
MRLNVSHSFLRSNCSPLFFGFVDSHAAKLHQHFSRQVKPERFLMLLNKQLKHLNKLQTPAGVGVGSDPEAPIAVVVAPAWKIPFLLRGYTVVEPKTSNHRAFIWIVGLAISLVSLGAIRVFELFDWLSKITHGKDAEVFGLEYGADPPGISLVPWYPEWISSSRSSQISSGQVTTPASRCEISPVDRIGYNSSTTHGVSPCLHSTRPNRLNEPVHHGSGTPVMREVDPLATLFSRSPLESLDASLNCPHFKNGVNQLCVICWLNSPELWVFGPVLSPLDRSILACLDKLANLTGKKTTPSHPVVGLATASTLLHRPAEVQAELLSGLASPSTTAWPNVVIRSTANLNDQPQSCSPRKRVLSCERLDRSSCVQSTPKVARSSGDGAPAASPADVCSSSISKAPNDKSPLDNLIRSPGRPTFYTSDSDVELASSRATPNSHTPNSPSPEQVRLSASRVISKALELLSSKSSDSSPRHQMTGGTSSLVTSPLTRRTGSHGSTRSLDSDPFEYDELHMSPSLNPNLTGYASSFNALDPEEDEQLQREEEAQLVHLLNTLTSLLDKVDHISSGSPDPLPLSAATDDGGDGRQLTDSVSARQNQQKNVPFTDLFQSASDITEDLQSLETVLDKLRYKLQANQIELEQAEDKLDYAWHLHDHLDGSIADSFSSGSLASLTSESVPLDPSTVNHSITLPSPLVLEVVSETQIYPTDPVPTNPHLLNATDVPLVDSLLTSYTSSYTSSSAEPDRLLQSVTDSACGQSISTYSSQMMIQSVPDAGCLAASSNQLEMITPNCTTLDRPRPRARSRSKRFFMPHRRYTFHTDQSYQAVDHDPILDYEKNMDPDGFLHPEMTFDKDGGIDWAEPNDAIR